MNCIVIEDEVPAQNLLRSFIEKTASLNFLGAFESVSELPGEVLSNSQLIFLDIQLPGMNGLDFLKSLPLKPRVVITTAYRDYALDAFEVSVEDYLLKPFSYERFLKAVLKVQHVSVAGEPLKRKEIFVYADKAFHKIFKDDILFVKSEVDYVQIFYGGSKLLVQGSLNNWEQKLSNDGFVRVHRSYLVNLDKITKIIGNIVYIGTIMIPVGKTYREGFYRRVLL